MWLIPAIFLLGTAMADPIWTKIKFADGMYPDEAPAEAEGFIRNGTGIRFVRAEGSKVGTPELIPGWEKASSDTFAGKARRIMQYSTNAGYPAAAIGTHTSTWGFFDGEIYFTTPIVSYGQLTNPFSTTDTDATITVAHTAHGRATGDYVNFPLNISVNGATLAAGYYAITKIDANSYTIEADSAATSSGAGVGGAVDYEYFLAAGNEFSLGGAGYGTGAYDTGTYGGSTSTAFIARVWTFAQFGQNEIGAPKRGGIYERAPLFTATDLAEAVDDGDMSVSTSWTAGSGWSVGSGTATGASCSTSLTQDLDITAGAWYVLKFTATVTAESVQPMVDGANVGAAVTASGRYFRRFWGGSGGTQTLAFKGVTAFGGTIDDVSVKSLGTFAPLENAPTDVTGVIVTPQGHVMAYGCVPTGLTEFDPMCVKTSDADDAQFWTVTTISREAREYFLYGGSRIITGLVGGERVYMITDAALWEGTYRGSPSLVWEFRSKGTDCGAIGINAATYAAGRVFWMGNNKTFWVFAGGAPEPLFCSGTKWIFENLAPIQHDLVQCWHNATNKEVWWEWPDKRDETNEVSRYAAYNYSTGKWFYGYRTGHVRTAIGETRAGGFPLGAGTDGYLYYHEKGDSADGAALIAQIEAGHFDMGDGNTLHEISGVQPDAQGQSGSFTMTFYGYEKNAQSSPETAGPVTITPSTTEDLGFFVQGRQSKFIMDWNDAPAAGRFNLSGFRFLIADTENQF